MTVVDTSTTELRLGSTFAYYGGQGVLVTPAPGTDEAEARWLVWNPSTCVLEEMAVTDPTWIEPTPMNKLIAQLASGLVNERSIRLMAESQLTAKANLVDDIRSYAIDRQGEGHFCRDGLNTALAHFGLEPYEPRWRVEVVVVTMIELNADDAAQAASRARYLVDGVAISGDSEHDDLDHELVSVEVGDPAAL